MKKTYRIIAVLLCLAAMLPYLPQLTVYAVEATEEESQYGQQAPGAEPEEDGRQEAAGETDEESQDEKELDRTEQPEEIPGEADAVLSRASAFSGAYTDPEFPAAISRVFPDPGMAEEVRRQLKAASTDSMVTLDELESIVEINAQRKVSGLEGVKFLTGVTFFQVYNSGFETIPPGTFTGMEDVTYISLYRGALTAIPAGAFKGLAKLEKLDFSDNQVASIAPDAFAGCVKLDNLTFSNNSLTELPAGLFDDLVSLDLLWFWWNEITDLDPGLFRNTVNLTRLELNGNLIERLPDGIFDSMPRLGHLSLSSNLLTGLPAGVFDNQGDMVLNLNYNRITDLSVLPDKVELLYNWTTYYTQYHTIRGYNADPLSLTIPGGSLTIRSQTGAPNDIQVTDAFDGSSFTLDSNPGTVPICTADGALLVQTEVEVYDKLQVLAQTPTPLPVGAAFSLDVQTDVRDGFTVTHTYESANGRVSVDRDGNLTALGEGQDLVTIVSRVDGSNVETTTLIHVYVYTGGIAPVKVDFDPQADDVIPPAPVFVFPGSAYGSLPTAYRDGYALTGWFTEPVGGERVANTTVVTRNDAHTLYARWKTDSEDSGGNGGTGGGSGGSSSRRDGGTAASPAKPDATVTVPDGQTPITAPGSAAGTNPGTGAASAGKLSGFAALCLGLAAVLFRAGRKES